MSGHGFPRWCTCEQTARIEADAGGESWRSTCAVHESGSLVALIVDAFEGAVVVGALGVFGAGLVGLGIPKDSVIQYETAVKAGKFLVIAHGTHAEADRAKDILTHAGLPVPDIHAALVA